MKHALVVGGTGMLRDVSVWLLTEGYHVSVIGRDSRRMQELIDSASRKDRITPLYIDYRNDDELHSKLQTSIQEHGEIVRVVAWIHSDAPRALDIISRVVSTGSERWELFHVLGSSSELSKIKSEYPTPENCSYHQIQLGFKVEDDYSRWLTNNEIAAGVIEAIELKNNVHLIGQLEPWELRP